MREQGERVKPASIAEVLETDEVKALLETGRESGTRRWLMRFFFVISRKLKPSS